MRLVDERSASLRLAPEGCPRKLVNANSIMEADVV